MEIRLKHRKPSTELWKTLNGVALLLFWLGGQSWAFQSAASKANDFFFVQINLLCGALASEGLATRSWKNTGPEYQCISPYVDIGGAGPIGLTTNIAYYVTGRSPSRASNIELVVNVNNGAAKERAKQKLQAATKTLFGKIGNQPPSGLFAAIQGDKPFSSGQPYGTVSYTIERSGIETYTLSIRDTKR